jgi:hypothetical protein
LHLSAVKKSPILIKPIPPNFGGIYNLVLDIFSEPNTNFSHTLLSFSAQLSGGFKMVPIKATCGRIKVFITV